MSDKYEIQWPLRVQMGTGVHGARAEVRDAGDISVAEFPSNHPDPKAAAEAEMQRLTDEYGPAWDALHDGTLTIFGGRITAQCADKHALGHHRRISHRGAS